MSERMYYWGAERNADPDETFIEFSAKGDSGGGGGGGGGAGDGGKVAAGGGDAAVSAPAVLPPPPPPGPPLGAEPAGREDDADRGGWGHKLDFLFSCISVSVGLGNVWRFPYLCYKNGGGAFLVTYAIAMVFCGMPIFFQEVAIGQYLGAGGMTLVGQLVPILQGVGYATMTIVFFLDVYYCIIIAWTLFYLIATFVQLPGLPWEDCDNWWNTRDCISPGTNATLVHNRTNHTATPVEEFWDRRVLQVSAGIEELGAPQWELAGCLLLAWVLVYLIIWRGLHQSGKVIWFTALFPYAVLAVLVVRAVTLRGAGAGLLYYVTPRWEELASPGPWIDGATQIFFAYSIGTGALPALGSYNKFHHNCYRDALITCVVNTLTSLVAGCVTFSILGFVASEKGAEVADVVRSGPGLVFLTYPEVVLQLPGAPAWAAVFFFMLVTLGIDSEFCIVESFVTGVVDNWPDTLRPHRRRFTFGVCCLMLLLGIPMITHGGAYVFQLMDFYSASGMSLLWVCFFQTIAISWIFGAEKFCDCVQQMMGVRPGRFWYSCWVFCAPLVMLAIFLFYFIQYKPVTYGKDYTYPVWAEVLGILISLSSMLWVPAYVIYYLLTSPGSIKENLIRGLKPNIKSRQKLPAAQKTAVIPMSESSAGLLTKNSSFLSQQ